MTSILCSHFIPAIRTRRHLREKATSHSKKRIFRANVFARA